MLKLRSDVVMHLESKKLEAKKYMIAFIIFSVFGIISSIICFLLFVNNWEKITNTSQLINLLLLFTFSVSFAAFLISQIFEFYAEMRHRSLILEMNNDGDLEKLFIDIPEVKESETDINKNYEVEVVGIPETGKTAPLNINNKNEVYSVKVKDSTTGAVFDLNPNINNLFYDTAIKNCFLSGKFILLDGELPDKWKNS